MKIKINRDLFLEKLNLASRFTATKFSSLPALQGVLIKGEKKLINFYSTSLNSYFHTSLKTEVNEPFQFVVEPKKTIEFLSLLSPGDIEIEKKEKQIKITQKKTKGTFFLIATEDFPLPPKIKEKEQKIKTAFFLKNLPLVLFSASQDTTRPVLAAINFLSQNEETIMVSTDGFRLSLLKLKKEIDLPQALVPAEFLNEILRLIKEEKEIFLSYSKEEKMVVFGFDDNLFFSRLIEGEYPPFEKVIPSETKTRIIVDKNDFLKNIKLVSIFAREHSNVVVLNLAKDGLYLSPKTGQEEENNTYQEVEFEGEEQKIAFNYKFLIDLLTHTDSKKITLEVFRPDSPAVFKTDNNPDFIHIIMPVRIQE